MYAVIGYLDERLEKTIQSVGNALFEMDITDYSTERKGYKPHITFASFEELDVDAFTSLLEKYSYNCNPINVTFPSLGIFLNSGILYFAPRVSVELLEFHQSFHEAIEPFKDGQPSLYSSERWVPHCTITAYLSQEQLLKAVEYCNKFFQPMEGTISAVGLIKVNIDNEGRATSEVLSVFSIKKD